MLQCARMMALAGSLGIGLLAQAQFEGFANKGLVGVGRLSASLLDRAGQGDQDTLGGFSAMAVDPESLVYADGAISGTLVGLPDRGFGDGATDYRPRMEIFSFRIVPAEGSGVVGQDQISLTNTATLLFT